jgi:hypothetical protein
MGKIGAQPGISLPLVFRTERKESEATAPIHVPPQMLAQR